MHSIRSWTAGFTAAIAHAHASDVLDIALIAALIYAAARWLRVARARFVVRGLLVLGGLYVVGRALHMRMSTALFEAGLPILLIALLVIFQEDLRRAVERVATLGPRALRSVSPQTVDTLVEACQRLATGHVGALLVLRGREPLDRHLTSGVALDGRLSAPLLYSIFDPHSAGHDGAVVLDGDRVRQFAAHLPLSTSLPDAGGGQRGTRHAAALGLSERSDALVVVVSEERGEISVARDGTLHTLDDGAELARHLHAFARGQGARPVTAPPLSQRHGPWLPRAGALAAATLLWLSLASQQQQIEVRTFDVPVSYRNLPEDWLVAPPEPARVAVTVSAPAPALDALQDESLSLGIDLEGMEPGARNVEVGPYNLELPPDVDVQRMTPASVRVVAQQTEPRELTVHARVRGSSAEHRRLSVAEVRPSTLRVLVARDASGTLTHLSTEPIELSELAGQQTREVGVVLPRGARLSPGQPDRVTVRFEPVAKPPPTPTDDRG